MSQQTMAAVELDPVPPIEAGLLINGGKILEGERIEIRNPARPTEVVGTIVKGSTDHVERAIAAAKAAQPCWAAMSFQKRAEIIALGIDRIEAGIEARAALYSRENGKTLVDARNELSAVPVVARLTLELAAEADAELRLPSANGMTTVRYVPYGVAACIVPWNSPVTLAALQIIPALLAGNGVVLKVPETCPLALVETAELLAEVLPAGILNIISGLPAEIGDRLTMHPDVGKIAFTGSVPSARKILANAAQSIKGITAELGGNDAAIVLSDVDLGEETMGRMANIVFRMAGQICMAIKRIYVPEVIHDDFVEAFGRAVDRMVVGQGLKPGVTMGPLHTREARERALRLVADAKARGATAREFGKIDDEAIFAGGYFMRPTIVTNVPDDAPLVTEEQFCPALPILRYRDVSDAIARANASIYGLGGSVWGQDIDKALAVARQVQAGTVFVNTHGTQNINRRAPYGGLKQSGVGRRCSMEGLREYMQSQTTTTFEGAGEGRRPMKRLVVGISGASGVIYGVRALEMLRETGVETHLVMSRAAQVTLAHETSLKVAEVEALASANYRVEDIAAVISSGSFKTMGMLVAPCSIRSLSEIASGVTSSLLSRAADVTLKERRRLVLLVRETPLHLGHLRSMTAVAEMGGIIAPPVPAFYSRPESLDEMIRHTIGRALDLFDLDIAIKRWRDPASDLERPA